jgi:hypothetical protein
MKGNHESLHWWIEGAPEYLLEKQPVGRGLGGRKRMSRKEE